MAAFIHIADQAVYLATSEIASVKLLMFGNGTEVRTKQGEAYRVWASPILVLAAIRTAEKRGYADVPTQGWGDEICAKFIRDSGLA